MKRNLTKSSTLLSALLLAVALTASDCRSIGHAIALAASGHAIMVAASYLEHLTIGINLNVIGSGASNNYHSPALCS